VKSLYVLFIGYISLASRLYANIESQSIVVDLKLFVPVRDTGIDMGQKKEYVQHNQVITI
jgi:hypothetical protein